MGGNISSNAAIPFYGFLSFRGSDTRDGLSKKIKSALTKAGCTAFYDEDHIRAGDFIDEKIREGIEKSNIHIVLLSENYADSESCVSELIMIMDRTNHGSTVIPVFIGVDPSDVENLTGRFGDGFKKLMKQDIEEERKKGKDQPPPDFDRCVRNAFARVAGVKGCVLVKPEEEEELVKKIVAEFERIKYEQSRRVDPSFRYSVIVTGFFFIFWMLSSLPGKTESCKLIGFLFISWLLSPLLGKPDFYKLIGAICAIYAIYAMISSDKKLPKKRGVKRR